MTPDFDLRLGRWEDVLQDVDCDVLITDPPYGAKVHDGHNAGVNGHQGDTTAVRKRMKERRKEGSGPMGPGTRRALHYDCWTEHDVARFVGHWSPRTRGWICAMTSHDLFPAWERSLKANGRYVFHPIPVIIPGMTVRLSGDGHSSWAVWLVAARPSTREFATWGTLPGEYRATRGGEVGHIGGKPYEIMCAIVRDHSRPGDIICDPCAGLATTGLAAQSLGRRFIGAEVDPETHAKALQRVSRGVQLDMLGGCTVKAPFPYFGGKRTIADEVWARFGSVRQYIEPFCGSAAVLLASPRRAPLEVIGDANMYIANFWRAVKCQPEAVWAASDYPVSHVDLYARHNWLCEPQRRAGLVASLMNPEWTGDARIAGWWAWGQCCWIGSGWCERERHGAGAERGDAGRGLQADGLGKVPHTIDAGRGLQADGLGKVPHTIDAGRGLSVHQDNARDWIMRLSARLERVRVTHGSWNRCLNHHYGDTNTAVFLDPPYLAFESLYATEGAKPIARDVEAWARENVGLRIALCGHADDYDLPGWDVLKWERKGATYGGTGTKDAEAIWFSPACIPAEKPRQASLFGGAP